MAEVIINIEARMSPDRYISITRARCIARYQMHSIPGRPEELQTNGWPQKTISFAFAGGEMRIRKHGGERDRDWVEVRDFRLRSGWGDEVFAYLDKFLGYTPPPENVISWTPPPRPVRDTPQA